MNIQEIKDAGSKTLGANAQKWITDTQEDGYRYIAIESTDTAETLVLRFLPHGVHKDVTPHVPVNGSMDAKKLGVIDYSRSWDLAAQIDENGRWESGSRYETTLRHRIARESHVA